MNYAEDRLDRRARTSSACSVASGSGSDAKALNIGATKSSTSLELEHDLNQAHFAIRRYSVEILPCDQCSNGKSGGLNRSSDDSFSQKDALQKLVAAHQLAGKTLRDKGSNRQAVFHFGMAWKICHYLNNYHTLCNDDSAHEHIHNTDQREGNDAVQEWKTLGDYAQMAELAGFPEVGVMALLYYRAGGSLEYSLDNGVEHETPTEQYVREQGCGCGMVHCGHSACFIAFPRSSTIIDGILGGFDKLSQSLRHHRCNHESRASPSVLDILNKLALLSGKTSGNTPKGRLLTMQQYMNERMGGLRVPAILQYWNCDVQNSCGTRPIHSVLLLLLLKLLYSSPISGPFLQLACHSIPYISAIFPTSSIEGRYFAKHYKSHWAYYIFIRALVLGERIKKKPGLGSNIAHTPVWNICIGADTCSEQMNETMGIIEDKNNPSEFYVHIRDLLSMLSKPATFGESVINAIYSEAHSHKVSSSPIPTGFSFDLPHPPIYVFGDSHVLSLAWQSICINPLSDHNIHHRIFVPYPSTGIKAWHFRQSTQFFTYYNLRVSLYRLMSSTCHKQQQTHTIQTIVISAGEIDCREGIGGTLLQGYYETCVDAVKNTVLQYLESVSLIASEFKLQVLIMPVAPHAYRSEKNGKALGRAKRRETMALWNDILRKELCRSSLQGRKYHSLFLLDYEKKLRVDDAMSPVGYVLHPSYNADYTHVNSAVVRLLQDSLHECGCDLSLL